MSTFTELVKNRYSVRNYTDKPVDESLLLKILETASLAPSACNNQPVVVIIVRKEETKKKLAKAYERPWFVSAPYVLALCCDRSLSWQRKDGKNYGDVDVAIAMDHITLAATEAGLGTCWVANFIAEEVKIALSIPDHIEPIVLTPVGYPASAVGPKKRKPLTDIVHWEKYQGKYSE